jgi:hypothetical protein
MPSGRARAVNGSVRHVRFGRTGGPCSAAGWRETLIIEHDVGTHTLGYDIAGSSDHDRPSELGKDDLSPSVTASSGRTAHPLRHGAGAHRHDFIGTEHLLLGLIRAEEGLAAHILHDRDFTSDDLHDTVTREITNRLAPGDKEPLTSVTTSARQIEMT